MAKLDTTICSWMIRFPISKSSVRSVRPLVLLWLVFAVVSIWLLTKWSTKGWPVGSFWWDELALSGAAESVRQGLRPAADFWSPFILPLYIKAMAQCWGGAGAGYLVECWLQAVLVLLLLTALLGRRQHAWWVYVLGAWLVLQVLLPFNIGSGVVDARLGTVAFAGSYNRLGGALIDLAVMLLVIRRDVTQDRFYVGWLTLVLFLCFLVKITSFQCAAAIVLLFALLVPSPGLRPLVFKSLALAALLTVVVLGAAGMLSGYLGALKTLSAIRLELMHQRQGISRVVLGEHRLELFVLVFLAALTAVRGMLIRVVWTGLVIWYLLAVSGVVVYMLTNFGDNGLSPVLVIPCVLLMWQQRLSATIEPGSARRERCIRALARCGVGIVGAGGVVYVGLTLYWLMALVHEDDGKLGMPLPVRNTVLSAYRLTDRADWAHRPPIWVPGVPLNMKSPATYAAYAAGLDDALSFLDTHVPDRRMSVYALDFPAYVFSLTGGYRIPHGTYPWMIFGHEVSLDHHPDPVALFADVDVLMLSKCSLALKNRRYLPAMYRLEIERRWYQIGDLQCWSIWRRA